MNLFENQNSPSARGLDRISTRGTMAIWFLAIAVAMTISLPARGELRNFTFHGTVTQVADVSYFLDDTITNGLAVEGSCTFDTSTQFQESVGFYNYHGEPFGVAVRIGHYVFTSNPRKIDVLLQVDNPEGNSYSFSSYKNVCSHPLQIDYVSFSANEGPSVLTNGASASTTNTTIGSVYVLGADAAFTIAVNIHAIEEASAARPPLPATKVEPAVEVKWQSALGYFYQIQSSTNLQGWMDVGEPVLGDGGDTSKFFRNDGQSTHLYRAKINNFQADGNSVDESKIRNFAFHGFVQGDNLTGSNLGGTPMDGFYVFNTQDLASSSAHTNSPYGIVVKCGDYIFRTNPKHVDFLAYAEGGNYLLRSYHNICSQPLWVDHIAWQLDSGPTNEIHTFDPPTLTNYTSLSGLTVEGVRNNLLIRAEITSIEKNPAVIPQLPMTKMEPAVEVQWQSALGCFYQLQSSTDGAGWSDVGEPIIGTGEEMSRFLPSDPGPQFSYRVIYKILED
jgi:hypothetical protein